MIILSPLEESIRIIMDITALIQWGINGLLRKRRIIEDEELKKAVCLYLLLLHYCFLEEWKTLNNLVKNDKRHISIMRVISPAIRRMKKWEKGYPIVRNQFLAHRHRDDMGKFVPIKAIFENPHVPTAYAEMIALGKFAELAMNYLCNLYPEETKNSTDWLVSQGKVKSSKGLRTLKEAEQELRQIESEMKKRLFETNLRLGNPLTGKFHGDDA